MLWAAIKLVAMPVAHRRMLFWLAFAIQLPAIHDEGTAYTPTRNIGPAFFIVFVVFVWNTKRNPILTAITGAVCVAGAFVISPEQGVAVFGGLLGWFIILCTQRENHFSARAAAVFFVAAISVASTFWHIGEFSTIILYFSGIFSFPLLPSPTNMGF